MWKAHQAGRSSMTSRKSADNVANPLAYIFDRPTFAAIAAAAESSPSTGRVLHDKSGSYLVLKPKNSRGKNPKADESAEVKDEKNARMRKFAELAESSYPSPFLRPRKSQSDQGSNTRTSWHSAGTDILHQPRPREQISSVLFNSTDHSSSFSSPQSITPTTTRPKSEDVHCTSPTLQDHHISEYLGMPPKFTEMSAKGGQQGASPVTPATEGIASQQSTPRPRSSHKKKAATSRIHPSPREYSNSSSLNPNQRPFQPRSTPQRSKRGGQLLTPTSQGKTALAYSAHQSNLDDPFSGEHSIMMSSNFSHTNQMYNDNLNRQQHSFTERRNMSHSFHQQPMQSQHGVSGGTHQQSSQDVRVQFPHLTEPGVQGPHTHHSPHGQQAAQYHHHPYGQQPSYPHHSSFPQQSEFGQRAPANYGSPYSGQPSYAQPPMHQQPSSYGQYPSYDESDHGRTAYAQPTEQRGGPMSAYQQRPFNPGMMNPHRAARIPSEEAPPYDSRISSLHATAKEDELYYFYHLDPRSKREYLEAWFGPEQSVSTLLTSVDPAADIEHTQPEPPQTTDTDPTASQSQALVPYTGHRTDPREAEMLLNRLNEVAGETHGMHDIQSDTARTVLYDPVAHRTPKGTSSESTVTTVVPQASNSEQAKKPGDSTSEQGTAAASSKLPLSKDPTKVEQFLDDVFDGRRRMTTHCSSRPPHGQADGTTSADPPKSFSVYRYTLKKPHSGAGDFKTPYNVIAEPEDKSYPVESFAYKRMIEQVKQKKLVPSMNEVLHWFRFSGANRDADAIAKVIRRPSTPYAPADPQQTPKAKAYPTPIGHERASGSKPSGKTSLGNNTAASKDVSKNPRPKDAANLVAGMLANLHGYATGSTIGDFFTRWGRPSEWAIDRSRGGDNSFFGGGFDRAPQRVARDPRYQQTLTHDGRSTYFEDPNVGKGKARAW